MIQKIFEEAKNKNKIKIYNRIRINYPTNQEGICYSVPHQEKVICIELEDYIDQFIHVYVNAELFSEIPDMEPETYVQMKPTQHIINDVTLLPFNGDI